MMKLHFNIYRPLAAKSVNKFKLNLLQTAKKNFGYRLSAFSLAAKSGYQQKINVEISYIIK